MFATSRDFSNCRFEHSCKCFRANLGLAESPAERYAAGVMLPRSSSSLLPVPRMSALALVVGAGAMTSACSSEVGLGDLRVLVEAEDVIVDGLEPGDSPENVRDGWAVEFERYVVVLGEVHVELTSDSSIEAEDPTLHAIDLAAVDPAGVSLWALDGLEEGRWQFYYGVAPADAATQRHASVDAEVFDAMVAGEWAYSIAGELRKADGVSCPPASLATPLPSAVPAGENAAGDPCYPAESVRFEIGVGGAAATHFGPCEVDGVPGFSITAGAEASVGITIHGDHLFFNGFPEGAEGGVMRLAQWLADCDLDLDGVVTQAELEAISPSDLVELDDRYQLGGSPITPIPDMWTYVMAQLETQGHFQGEGECPIDGTEHAH